MMRIPTLLFAALLFCPVAALGGHGISIDGKLKYPATFTHFDYADPDAVKGGTLVLHDLGSFDKMNPYTLKGTSPSGLEELVFETLAVASEDEPFAEYGLIAEDIELAPDRMSATFRLRPQARFSDNTPITAEDVLFSLHTLKSDNANPFYQSYFHDIRAATVLGPREIRFEFAQKNRELHLIAAQMPILSKSFFEKHSFAELGMTAPVGSGPYLVDQVDPGKTISYRRNPDYWGKDLPVRRGLYNFDRVVFKYYKDQIVAVEAFKAGEFDFMSVNIAKQWARDLEGPKFDKGVLKKEMLPHGNNAGMQGFVFNTRKKLFQDRRVRQAIGLAFDFDWTNTTLFFGQYSRADSYFSNSYLAARGLPSPEELRLLDQVRDKVPAEVFTAEMGAEAGKDEDLRGRLRRAMKLLAEAGWQVRDGVLTDGGGESFVFEILLVSPSFERVMAPFVNNLAKLGIKAGYRTIDPALYTRRLQKFDYDMIVTVFGQSQSPGNEQRDYWHSSAVEREGSRNYAGIRDPAVDFLTEKIIYAETQEQLITACRALDRVLWFQHYVVPNWYLAQHRIAYRNIFGKPATLPVYYSPMQLLMSWWLLPQDR
ncbi:MAG: extracellular solute-binding protein [Thermodesulfobacteriota bacterium]